MAFESKNLKLLSYAGGFSLWHYHSNDNIKMVEQYCYFEKAFDLLKCGDLIIVQAMADRTHQKNKKRYSETPPVNSKDGDIDMCLVMVNRHNDSMVVTHPLHSSRHKRRR